MLKFDFRPDTGQCYWSDKIQMKVLATVVFVSDENQVILMKKGMDFIYSH